MAIKIIAMLLLATPVFADVYEPESFCHVVSKNGDEAEGYPTYKKVVFTDYQKAEEYAYLVNGLLLKDKDTSEFQVFHADGIDVPLLNMQCGFSE